MCTRTLNPRPETRLDITHWATTTPDRTPSIDARDGATRRTRDGARPRSARRTRRPRDDAAARDARCAGRTARRDDDARTDDDDDGRRRDARDGAERRRERRATARGAARGTNDGRDRWSCARDRAREGADGVARAPRPAYVPGVISDPKYVRVFDTTLRDGEQSPGATLTSKEKLDIATSLARLGVDIIEAGFPIASPDDLEAVRGIAKKVGNEVYEDGYVPVICGLSRANKKDIDAAWEGVRHALRPRIHTFIATSRFTWRASCEKPRTKSWPSPWKRSSTRVRSGAMTSSFLRKTPDGPIPSFCIAS